MQMGDKLPANKSPPTPLVQTPLSASTIAPVFPSDEKSNASETNASQTTPAAETVTASGMQTQQEPAQLKRSISQSSENSSIVPELVAATNNAINN